VATASIEWVAENGVVFDYGKMEAVLFYEKQSAPRVTVAVGTNNDQFNKEVTRWLGIWLDAQLCLKEHHAIRMNEGKKALMRLWWLTRQMGFTLANCRKVMTVCVQSATMFGVELWWKEDYTTGTQGWVEEIQWLINQEAWATMGCFQTTNLGALLMESGLSTDQKLFANGWVMDSYLC